MRFKTTRIIAFLLCLVMMASVLAGCGEKKTEVISNNSKPVESNDADEPEKELTPEEKEAQEAFASSTAENDTDVGLKNIKIDTAAGSLTDGQKAVLEYFDEDYLSVPNYEFLRRYPNVYENAQIEFNGFVKKVISASADEYKIVLWMVHSGDNYCYRDAHTWEEYESYLDENAQSYVMITGKPDDTWYMEDDFLQVYGRYTGIETVEFDGASYTVPCVNVSKSFISSDLGATVRYDLSFIKGIAKSVFGEDIEVRLPQAGTDYDESQEWRVADEKPFYIVELEDQSNAKFTKYRFYTFIGCIEDAKSGDDFWLLGNDPTIRRQLEFSADFEHYFLFTYDLNLETLTLEYYDSSLNKVWKQEFEETTSAVYDYTKNNIYLVANNELHIINIETGEDTFAPSFIGSKKSIRKLSDGILTVGESKSDAIIKTDLDGNMIWKTNVSDDIDTVNGIQLIGNNIVIQLTTTALEMHYIVIDNANGSVIQDATSIS